jgi:hypothetical protein
VHTFPEELPIIHTEEWPYSENRISSLYLLHIKAEHDRKSVQEELYVPTNTITTTSKQDKYNENSLIEF